MNELRTENWNGYTIRFFYVNGEWMAVLKDVCDAMGLETWKVRERLQKGLPKREDLLTNNKPKVHQHLSKEVLFRYPFPQTAARKRCCMFIISTSLPLGKTEHVFVLFEGRFFVHFFQENSQKGLTYVSPYV